MQEREVFYSTSCLRFVGGVCYVDRYATDLSTITSRIPYFKSLGLTYVHLMPLFDVPEPENDGGYAVTSYRRVKPILGNMDQLKELAKAFADAGISLVLGEQRTIFLPTRELLADRSRREIFVAQTSSSTIPRGTRNGRRKHAQGTNTTSSTTGCSPIEPCPTSTNRLPEKSSLTTTLDLSFNSRMGAGYGRRSTITSGI
jgi:hypothetical protein